jgi:hypothetical protein
MHSRHVRATAHIERNSEPGSSQMVSWRRQ